MNCRRLEVKWEKELLFQNKEEEKILENFVGNWIFIFFFLLQ